jgi:hypothetical protein
LQRRIFTLPSSNDANQQDTELAQALRVHAMTQGQRSDWLQNVWGRVQRNAQAFLVNAPDYQPTARSYASLEGKNRFDEARELAFALQYSVYAVHKASPTPTAL